MVSRTRWFVLGLLFLSTVLNYLDRQALSILATAVQRDLGMDDLAYAHVVQLFLLAYTLAYLLAGRITDLLGSRLALALFVGWWSVANMVTGLVRSAGELGAARFALGLGEAGNYTVGPKVVGEQFTPAERGLAFGIYTSGAMVGATLAPPLIGYVGLTHGWRAAFVLTGAAGLVWIIGWLWVFPRTPAAPVDAGPPVSGSVWKAVLSDRTVWMLALSRALADPVWYFYLFWFPKYLGEGRGMALASVAALAWIVYLAADLGSIGGGLLSSVFVRRGVAPGRARLLAMGLAAAIAPIGALAFLHPALPLLFAIASLVAFAHMVFQINMGTLIVDLYPTRVVATVFGVIAAGSGLGGMVSTQAVGLLVAGGQFDRAFLLMALLHPLAWGVAALATRRPSRLQATASAWARNAGPGATPSPVPEGSV